MINSKRLIIFVLVLMISFVIVGCKKEVIGTADDNTPQGAIQVVHEPDIIGEILDVKIDNDIRILIDSTTGTIKGQIWVAIEDGTAFYKNLDGNEIDNVYKDDFFVIGNEVGVRSDGIIMESYPMQTKAVCVYQAVK